MMEACLNRLSSEGLESVKELSEHFGKCVFQSKPASLWHHNKTHTWFISYVKCHRVYSSWCVLRIMNRCWMCRLGESTIFQPEPKLPCTSKNNSGYRLWVEEVMLELHWSWRKVCAGRLSRHSAAVRSAGTKQLFRLLKPTQRHITSSPHVLKWYKPIKKGQVKSRY